MSVLLTGSSGFIGQHLQREMEVIPFDRLTPTGTKSQSWWDASKDLALPESTGPLREAVQSVDAVIHLAGNADAAAHISPEVLAADINAAYRVLDTCYAVQRSVVVASSAFAISRNTPYGIAKGAVEDLAAYYRGMGLRVGIARLFNVYGPGQEHAVTYSSAVVLNLYRAISKGDYGVRSRWNSRDFIYIDDVVAAFHHILRETCKGRSDLYEVGSGSLTDIWDLAKLMALCLGCEGQLEDLSEGPPFHQPYTRPAQLNRYPSTVSLKQGVGMTVQHLQKEFAIVQ